MAYTYTSRNGQRVEVNVAAAFDRLNAAFKAKFGLNLLVSSGTRTRAEQQHLYNLYKAGKGNLAAAPGYSNHEESGPRGPRALDVRDSGSNAGVTVRGTTRANWLRSNASKYGFNPAGYGFSQIEPWHIEFTGVIGGSGGGTPASGGLAVDGNWGAATTSALQRALGVTADGKMGPVTVKALQTRLKNMGHKITVDGKMGPATVRAMQVFIMGAKLADSKLGPETVKALQRYLNSGGKFVKASTPTPPPPSKLTVDGLWGTSTTKALQKALGVTQDGELGPKTYTALQKKLVAAGHKIAVDGEMGPATIKALQTFILGAKKADGKIGPETVKGLQNYLNSGGTFVVKTPTPDPKPTTEKLTVDGNWGPATTRALQTNLKVSVDGEMGPITVKALQKALGVTQDGEIGPNTIKALQVAVGATVDGAMGPNTIKALQTFLNAGKTFTAVVVPDPDPVVSYPKPAKATYPGATWWNHSPNSSPRRVGDKVQYFVVHHAAATSSVVQLRNRFMAPNDRNVSPNWLIGADGSISEIVPSDKYRAWTSGQFDYNAVTVETQNTSGAPTWGISEASHIAIAKLVAWASKRYGFPIDRTHVIGHKDVPGAATACPGPSMNLDKIINYAKGFADPGSSETEEPEVPDTPEKPNVWTIELPKDEAEALAGLLDKLRDLLP